MKLHHLAIGLTAGLAVTTPAFAQYGATAPAQQTAPRESAKDKKKKEAQPAEAKQPKVSSGALKDMQALDKAVKAKDAANIPALIAAAKASSKTPDDHYVVAQLSLAAAIDANNKPAIIDALNGIIASGFLSPADQLTYQMNIGKLNYEAKNFDAATAALEKADQIAPNNVDILASLSDSYNQQKRYPEALGVLRRAIGIKAASGTKADESWYRRATAIAFNNKLPNFVDVALEWLKAYPSKVSWSDTLRIYQQANQMDPVAALDVSRLLYAAGAMQSENDYYRYANAASTKGFPGEALTVLDSGFAAGTISKGSAALAPLYASVTAKAKGDRESLTAAGKAALAAPAARQALTIGDAYYGYGDHANAIALYRAALGKTGADKDLINLHLGMALARSGDKAGAKSVLESVGGAHANTAKFWLVFVG